MSYAQVSIPGDGSTTLVPVEFALGAISPSMVRCYVTGELDGGGGQVYRTFTFTTSTMAQVDGAPAPIGQFYIFERIVPKDELIVDWTDGDPITGENLDKMQKQSIHMTHEALDLGDRAVKAPVGASGKTITASTANATLMIDPVTGNIIDGPTANEVANAQQYALDAAASAQTAADLIDDAIDAATVAGTAAGTVAGQAAANAAVATHVADTGNPHNVTKVQVGLGSVDNVSAADLRDRTTHTGQQAISTVADLQTTLDGKAPIAHVSDTNNPHNVTKAQVGLGNVDNTADSAKPVSTAQAAAIAAKQSTSEKAQPNGYASLGSDGKVPSSQLPTSGSYKGTWNAATNTPTITSGVGVNGDFYKVATAGSTTIDGTSTWTVGDEVRFNGTVWQRIINSSAVSSVNGQTGAVVIDTAASASAVTPTGNIASTNVQAALAELDSEKVAKSGDTMTGSLTFNGANLGPILNSTGVGARRIKFQTNGVERWQAGADGTVETGSGNVGTNFVINAHDDAGAVLGTPLSINRSTMETSIRSLRVTTALTSLVDMDINKSYPQIRLNKTANTQTSSIAGQLNGQNLWNLVLGTATAGDYNLNAYDDAGAFIRVSHSVNRATGAHLFGGAGTFTGDLAVQKNFPDVRMLTANNRGWRATGGSTGTTLGDLTFQATTDGFGSSFVDALKLGSDGLTTALGSFKYIKSILLNSGTDVDTVVDAAPCYTGAGLVNGPIVMGGTSWAYLEVLRFSQDANYVLQKWTAMNIGGADGNPPTWYRYRLAGNWSAWYPLSGFVTPRHFAAAGSSTAAGATSAQTGPLTSFMNSPFPKYLDQWYRVGGAIAIDMDLQGQNGWQLFGVGGQSGLVMAGGAINLTNADVPNPTGTASDLVTLKDFMMVKAGYDSTVPLTVAFKDGDTGSSMPSLQMSNVHLTAATNTDGCSGAHIALHNCRNSQVNNCSVFGRYGTYNGNAFQLTGGASSASVEVYFNNCRVNHVQKGFYVGPSGGAVANDDMQGIHWHKCTAIAVDRGWELQGGAEGFGEWFVLDACHAYFRELGVYGVNAGNIRSDHGYYLGHGNLATIQGIAITGTSIEPWNALTYNRVRLDAATGATRLGINANAQTGIAQGNRVSNATTAYTFAGGWTNVNNS